jgi:hypothetical protein
MLDMLETEPVCCRFGYLIAKTPCLPGNCNNGHCFALHSRISRMSFNEVAGSLNPEKQIHYFLIFFSRFKATGCPVPTTNKSLHVFSTFRSLIINQRNDIHEERINIKTNNKMAHCGSFRMSLQQVVVGATIRWVLAVGLFLPGFSFWRMEKRLSAIGIAR